MLNLFLCIFLCQMYFPGNSQILPNSNRIISKESEQALDLPRQSKEAAAETENLMCWPINNTIYPEPLVYSYSEYFSDLQKEIQQELDSQKNMLNRIYPLFRTYREQPEIEKNFCKMNQLELPDNNTQAPFFRIPETFQDYDKELKLTTAPWSKEEFPEIYQWCEKTVPFIKQLESATQCTQFAFVFPDQFRRQYQRNRKKFFSI